MASIEDCQEWHKNELPTPKETKLTEPVQVGLWYETKRGEKVQITDDFRVKGTYESFHNFGANNGFVYSDYGRANMDNPTPYDLIRCLGADPFKQDNEDMQKLVEAYNALYLSKQETPTQFERIFTAVLGRNINLTGPYDPNAVSRDVSLAIVVTQEAIKQLKEIEGA